MSPRRRQPTYATEKLMSGHLGEYKSSTAFGDAIGKDVPRALRLAREKQGLPTLQVMVAIAEGLDIDVIDVIVACASDAGVDLRPAAQPQALRDFLGRMATMPPRRMERIIALIVEDD